ncbi:unnamed protein product [Ectocarpus sp. CCAP 1310/34]|nr:unnamed protein product [Ectocarpus sp. CCAP 1310/34]
MLRLGTSLVRHGARASSRQAAPAVAVATVRLSVLSRGGAVSATARVAPTTGVWARHGAIGGSLTHFVRHLSSGGEEVIPVPSMGDSISEGTIVEWAKQPGDSVELDEVVVVLETDKVSIDVRAPSAGTLVEQMAADGDIVEVGAPLMKLDTSGGGGGGGAAAAAPADKAAKPPKEPSEEAAPKPPPAPQPSPAAAPPAPPAAAAPAPAAAPAAGQKVALPPISPAANGDRTESRVKMTRMRMRIAERLKSAQNTAAMLTTFQECDMSHLMNMRKAYKDDFEKKHGIKLGFMSCFVKASADALREMPAVNGYIDDKAKEIVYRNYVDVSVAVSSPNGLVVPVLRNVEDMGFADVEKAIAEYGRKAKEGSLALEDMAGGSFTISNGGVFGSLMGTPIINPPQSAILGMHATKMRAVVGPDGQVVARPMMYLALTYDHRLIDGREAVTFLKSVALKVQDPTRLLLDL